MGFGITDGFLLGSPVGQFIPDMTDRPVFIRYFFNQLDPVVRNSHGKAVVKSIAAAGKRSSQPRHAADIFSDGSGIGPQGMDQFAGQRQVG